MRLRKTLTNRPLRYPRTKHARNRQWASIALASFYVIQLKLMGESNVN